MELPTLESLRQEQRALRAELSRLQRRLRRQLALEFAVDAAAVLVATATALVLLDWTFRLGLPARWTLLVLSLAGALGFLGVRAVRRWRSAGLDELSLAMTLDRYRPGTGQMIADVLQLPGLLDEPGSSASPAMVRLAVRRACAALAGSDWRRLWNHERTSWYAGVLVIAILVPWGFAVTAPDAARLSVDRWLRGSNERWPQRTYLSVIGLDPRGRLVVPRDERSLLEVRADLPMIREKAGRWLVGGRGEPLALRRKPSQPLNPRSVTIRERMADGSTREAVLVETEPGHFRHEFPPSPASSTFELTGGDDWIDPLVLDRVDRPSLAETRVRVREPGATYSGFRGVDDPRQHLVFLPDTEVEMTLVGTEPLSDARLKIQSGTTPPLKRIDEKTFATNWTLREATTLEVSLVSKQTGLDSRPAFLSVGLLRDREPRVTLRAVGVGAHVTPVATIPLSVAATDDLGLAALRLQLDRSTIVGDKDKPETKTKRETVQVPLPSDAGRTPLDHQARHDVPLLSDPPVPGTVLRFAAEADDRCARGVQTGRSTPLQFQVVSPEELFYEILLRQRAERAKFMAALEAIEKQTPVLAGRPKSDDFLRVMRAVQTTSRHLDQIGGRIADTLQEMKLNQVGSPKSHRLLQQGILEPMKALNAGPMNELRGMLQALSGAGAQAGASEDAARNLHAQVVAKMKGILEQMSQWESFVDVVNQVAEVIRMQQRILQDTEKARETRTKEVFDEKP
jgi:hypothetical protein